MLACRKVSWNNDEIHIDELIVAPQSNVQASAKNFYEKNGFQVSDGVICMYWVDKEV